MPYIHYDKSNLDVQSTDEDDYSPASEDDRQNNDAVFPWKKEGNIQMIQERISIIESGMLYLCILPKNC